VKTALRGWLVELYVLTVATALPSTGSRSLASVRAGDPGDLAAGEGERRGLALDACRLDRATENADDEPEAHLPV
jgi:hypothetical protein